MKLSKKKFNFIESAIEFNLGIISKSERLDWIQINHLYCANIMPLSNRTDSLWCKAYLD